MSFAVVTPQLVAAASADLETIGSAFVQANTAATRSTTSVVAAARDEVSLAVAALFSGHGQAFQQLTSQATAWQRSLADRPAPPE